jgi:hypothetical protein
MRTAFAAKLVLTLCLFVPAAGMAQHGHPLVGIWLGAWGTGDASNDVVLELNWMNTTLSGNINPGFPDEATIDVGELNPSDWTVHLEGMSKDEEGKPVRVIIDGQLDKLGSANRSLSGTWTRGAVSGEFELRRE